MKRSDITMKMLHLLFVFTLAALLSACSPHPAAGVWQAADDNDYGISKLVVSFDGKANFITGKLDNTTWHCFWGATGRQEVNMDCSSSTNTDPEERFILTINDQDIAELQHKSRRVATFTRLDENPTPGK